MNRSRFFSSGTFAKLSRTTRNTLHLYDNINLLPPAFRATNNYRYYSNTQLAIINLIHILQESGLSLDEIVNVKEQRTPKFINDLYINQINKIDAKIEDLVEARKLLLTLQKTIDSTFNIDETAVTIQFLSAEAIILGELNDYSNGKNDYDALTNFYQTMNNKYPNLNLNYPVWGKFSEEQLKNGDLLWPDRYYFYNPDGYDRRPAALYAIGHARGGYGTNDELFKRLTKYIDDNGFEICGDAYVEYPLNEICVSDDTNYLIRIMITVRKKTG